MQRLEVSGALQPIEGSSGIKGLSLSIKIWLGSTIRVALTSVMYIIILIILYITDVNTTLMVLPNQILID
jgi:hypothetical protein